MLSCPILRTEFKVSAKFSMTFPYRGGFIDYDQCEYPRAEDPGPSNGEIILANDPDPSIFF